MPSRQIRSVREGLELRRGVLRCSSSAFSSQQASRHDPGSGLLWLHSSDTPRAKRFLSGGRGCGRVWGGWEGRTVPREAWLACALLGPGTGHRAAALHPPRREASRQSRAPHEAWMELHRSGPVGPFSSTAWVMRRWPEDGEGFMPWELVWCGAWRDAWSGFIIHCLGRQTSTSGAERECFLG